MFPHSSPFFNRPSWLTHGTACHGHSYLIYCLALQRPSLGFCLGDSLTHLMLIIALFFFLTLKSPWALQWSWVPKGGWKPKGVWTGNSSVQNPLRNWLDFGNQPLYEAPGILPSFEQKMNTEYRTKSHNINPLSVNFTKWSNTLKQFVGKLPTNCLSVFDHFAGLAFKGLKTYHSFYFHQLKSSLQWNFFHELKLLSWVWEKLLILKLSKFNFPVLLNTIILKTGYTTKPSNLYYIINFLEFTLFKAQLIYFGKYKSNLINF